MASRGLILKVNTTTLERKLKAYRDNLISLLRSEWAQIIQECLVDIASRAPAPDEELMFILGSLGYPETTPIPKYRINGPNIVFAKDFPYAGERVHFNRAPGTWIKDAITAPGTYFTDAGKLTASIGYVPELERMTSFSYVNFSRRLGPSPHTTPYGVWSFFEYGKTNTVTPNMSHWTSWWGHPKLKPMGDSFDSPHWVTEMTKNYPTMGMYTGFDKAFLREAVATRIKHVKY